MTESTTASESAAAPAAQPMHRIFTATLVMGISGSGKTSLYKSFSEYLWETYRRVLLLYSWDGGAIPTDVQKRMRQGLIRYWRARTRSAPGLALETLYLATKGYWPRRINAETGETAPAVELVPPVTTTYTVSCPKGHTLSIVPARSLIAPTFCTPCKQLIGLAELHIAEQVTRTKGFELVGGVGFDGLTSMTDVVLDHMDIQRGEGLIGGEKSAFGGVVVSGSQKFGGTNRADIGFGQTRGHQFVNNSLSIPNLVEGPVWTALTTEVTDEGGMPIVGAKLPGRAATEAASSWFGNVMETGKLLDGEGKSCFALWLRPFTDAQNRRHLLKTSASPTGVPDKLVDPAEELRQPYTSVNLGRFFKMLDEDLQRGLQEELPGAPGIPTAVMDYGEARIAAPVEALVAKVPTADVLIPAGGAVPAAAVVSEPIPVPAPPPAAPGPGLMVAKPRARKGPQTIPVPESARVAATPPASVAAPAVETRSDGDFITVTMRPPAAKPTGTAPPPPPGMRPPMRAPGAS